MKSGKGVEEGTGERAGKNEGKQVGGKGPESTFKVMREVVAQKPRACKTVVEQGSS